MIFTVHNETTFIKNKTSLQYYYKSKRYSKKNVASYCLPNNTIPESEIMIARNFLIDLQSGSSFYVCKVL